MFRDNYLVWGLGISGVGAVNLLLQKGKNVFVYDKRRNLCDELKINKIVPDKVITLRKINKKQLHSIDCIVLSPGVRVTNNQQKIISALNIEIKSEIDLAYEYCESNKIIAITGTNGKTTTVNLINDMLNQKNKSFLVGNVGISFCDKVSEITKNDFVVCELSSFQLENTYHLCPKCVGFLNFSADHLDKYKSLNEYFYAKKRILDNVHSSTIVALNYDDEKVRNLYRVLNCKVLYFSLCELPNNQYGMYHKDNKLIYKDNQMSVEITLEDCQNISKHNLYNIMCACILALNLGVTKEEIEETLKMFNPPKHRLQIVATVNGVTYIDDSKATNTHATKNALQSIDKPIRLLLGGSNKGEKFDEFFRSLPNNLVEIVTFGQMSKKLYCCAKKCGIKNITCCTNLQNAFDTINKNVNKGEVVLLSPGCASFDEFNSYEERGDYFQYLVNEIS